MNISRIAEFSDGTFTTVANLWSPLVGKQRMYAWRELERITTTAAMLREHLYRAIGYGDEGEIRRLRAELALIAKRRRDALTDLSDQMALYA